MNQPIFYQRLEGALVFLASLYFYLHLGFSWVWFVVFLFSVDVFMLGYLHSKELGAHIYNLGHSYIFPALLLVLGVYIGKTNLLAVGLVWTAHIGWDRAFGYGLKFSSGFKDTHLGQIGKK